MSNDIKTQGLKGNVPFTFALLESGDETVIRAKIDGPIGFRFEEEDGSMVGETAASFLNAVSEAKAANPAAKWLEVDLNTPGGIFNEAVAIKTGLEGTGLKVRFRTTSISASAGAYLAVIGDEHLIAEDASMMIHQASGGVWGSAAKIKAYADSVEQINGIMVKRLSEKSGKDAAEIAALIDGKDYWMTGLDAVAMGFADGLIEPQNVTACADVEELQALNAPEDVIARAMAAADPSDQEGEDDAATDDTAANDDAAGDTGETKDDAAGEADETGAETDATPDQENPDANAGDEGEVEELSEDAQEEIRAACAVARQEAKAAEFIQAKTPIDQVRAALFDLMAAADEQITTSSIRSAGPDADAPVQKTAAQISAERRQAQHSKFF